MREIRLYSSEGGEAFNPFSLPYQTLFNGLVISETYH